MADLIRGKSVSRARAALSFLPKKSGPVIGKLLDSAVANAQQAGMETGTLYVKTITVDKGAMTRRFRPFGRGRSGSIRKMMSIVKLELGTSSAGAKAPTVAKAAKSAAATKPAAVKKTVAKKTTKK